MRQRLTSVDLSIEELLSGRYVFSIPSYQRDYTWTKAEANQLVDDIAAVIDDVDRDGADIPYFLGTMLLVAGAGVNGTTDDQPRQVEVVDGQQRLVTLAILFSVLRDLLEETESDQAGMFAGLLQLPSPQGGSIWQLRLRGNDEEFFRDAIQVPGASRRGQPGPVIGSSTARRNIEEVRRAIRSKFQREYAVQGRQRFADFARRHVRVLVVSSDDMDYAYQIFLTINERGKRLSLEDIFRGEILGPLDREQRERYESIIDEMEKYRQKEEETRAKGKTFFTHLATIDGWPRRGIIQGLKKAVERRGGPRRFVSEMFAPMAEAYLQVKGAGMARPMAAEVAHWLTALRWLERHGDDDWVPVAMLGLGRLGSDPDALTPFLKALDRFAHGLMALGCGRDARRKHYAPILKRLLEEGPLPVADKLFAISLANQKMILRNIATRIHSIDPPTAKLVLLRADQAITGRAFSAYQPYVEVEIGDPRRFTIEHVCPQGEIKAGEWLELFPRQTLRTRAAQCIGNLALVTESQNKRVSQREFAEKKWVFFPDGTASPFHLTEVLRSEAQWDGAAIERRYDLIMAAVKRMWSLEGPVPRCPAVSVKSATG